ncbi:hypothetical protein RUM43_008943 [Polyplax serrata]|uniref:Uncharacterized protein n=1 Tax=Polyplax serrata TaxID=468196 RepID=A0AAN8NZ36_POLSC
MGLSRFAAVFIVAYLVLPDESLAEDSSHKSRLRVFETRHQFTRFPILGFLPDNKHDLLEKKQDQFDDYGHMRFGKRGEDMDDYGHMRFGKRD